MGAFSVLFTIEDVFETEIGSGVSERLFDRDHRHEVSSGSGASSADANFEWGNRWAASVCTVCDEVLEIFRMGYSQILEPIKFPE